MELVFLRSFMQDLKRIKDPAIRRKIERTVKQMQAARSLHDIRNVKKLEGHAQVFRVRIGDYLIGFFLKGSTIELAVAANRRDIYRSFP